MLGKGEDSYGEMSQVFNEGLELKRRKQFSDREVGLTHPDNNGFIRITDSGEIEIFGAPGVGLIINPNTKTISLFADTIKLFCKDNDGLRWNEKSFNPASDVYNEPSLVKTNDFMNNPAYYKSSYYLNNIEKLERDDLDDSVTMMRRTVNGFVPDDQNLELEVEPNGLSFEQKKLVDNYALTHSDPEIDLLIDLLKTGYSFSQAIEKVQEKFETSRNVSEEYDDYYWMRNNLDK